MEAAPGGAERRISDSAETGQLACSDCGQTFKTVQGLTGHRRLAHSASSARALDERKKSADHREAELRERETAAERRAAETARSAEAVKRREVEVRRREREIAETGPSSIGLSRCEECEAWFEGQDRLSAHTRVIHPLEPKVAEELGVGRGRVSDVWVEACRKQERHPDETPEQIVRRFWDGTDQRILHALLARNAAFHFRKED